MQVVRAALLYEIGPEDQFAGQRLNPYLEGDRGGNEIVVHAFSFSMQQLRRILVTPYFNNITKIERGGIHGHGSAEMRERISGSERRLGVSVHGVGDTDRYGDFRTIVNCFRFGTTRCCCQSNRSYC